MWIINEIESCVAPTWHSVRRSSWLCSLVENTFEIRDCGWWTRLLRTVHLQPKQSDGRSSYRVRGSKLGLGERGKGRSSPHVSFCQAGAAGTSVAPVARLSSACHFVPIGRQGGSISAVEGKSPGPRPEAQSAQSTLSEAPERSETGRESL